MTRAATSLLFTLILTGATPRAAFAAGVAPASASPEQRNQAQSHFQRGKQLYGETRFEEALVEFTASLDIVASPNARLYVARCHREMGHLVDAYVEFVRTATEARENARKAARYAKTAGAALTEVQYVEPKLGFLQVNVKHADDGTRLLIGANEVSKSGWGEPMPMQPGTAEIVLESLSRGPLKETVTIAPGATKVISFDAGSAPSLGPSPPAQAADNPAAENGVPARLRSDVVVQIRRLLHAADEPPSSPPAEDEAPPSNKPSMRDTSLRTAAYVAGGVSAAGWVTFAIAGIAASSTYKDLDAGCQSGPCPESRRSEITRGKTEVTITNVGLAVGIVGLAAGAGSLLAFTLSAPKKSHDMGQTAAPGASVDLVLKSNWVGMRSEF
jgi:hypothetical protein